MRIKTTQEISDQIGSKIQNRFIRWIPVDDILDFIENLRKSNDIWRFSATELFLLLEDEILRGKK